MLKVGIFTDTYYPQVNGVTFTVKSWIDGLVARGHEVRLFYPSGDYKPQKNEFPSRSMEFRFYKGYKMGLGLDVLKHAKGLDVVHIQGLFNMAVTGYLISRMYRIPRILTFHTPVDEYIGYITKSKRAQAVLRRMYAVWQRRLFNSCEVVTVPTGVIKERLEGMGVRNVVVLSNGIDTNFFKRVDYAAFRRKYNVPDGKVIGFCGRFGYEKHLEDLITYADEFDGTVLLAGSGPAEDYYKKIAAGKKNVMFLGFLGRAELLAFYSNLDVFVFPSLAETQGLVALESMACGVPVVGANALALKETIVDGFNGYHYTQGNLSELREKLALAYENKGRLSGKCVEFANQHSTENTIEQLVGIYENAVGRRKRR
ncbi:MAG: glycosyltransferase [Candidatus Altiarchaeota archaeon]|nr:glycosyltransferase [Candidatus Altiarchaeota archaeon]